MKNKGFTLIELMIIVAIISILFAIAIPNFINFQCRAEGIRLELSEDTVWEICTSQITTEEKYSRLEEVAKDNKENAEVLTDPTDLNTSIGNLETQIKDLKLEINQKKDLDKPVEESWRK